MRAQTMLDLSSLVADLPGQRQTGPTRPAPMPGSVPPPGGTTGWSGFDLICLLLLLGCLMVAGVLVLVAAVYSPYTFFGALVGGAAAAVGGAAAMHLGRRSLERRDRRIRSEYAGVRENRPGFG